MSTITLNVVQTFALPAKGKTLVADQPMQFKTAEEAIRRVTDRGAPSGSEAV